jgi:hypothetical protein
MKQRDFLIDGDDALVRTLLSAAVKDAPSERAMQRTLHAVSGAAPFAIMALAAKAQAGTTVSGVTALQSGATVAALVKWGAGGFVLGALVVGTAAKLVAPPPRAAAPAPVVSQGSPAAPQLSGIERSSPSPKPADSAAVTVPTWSRPTAMPSTRPDEMRRAESADGLARETALLDRARALLRAGDHGGARVALEAYASSASPKRLEPEALLLRMELAVAVGDENGGRATGRTILRQFPASPQATRARAIVESLNLKGGTTP